ncbi:MAG: lyase family protein, partial [Pseudomonadota bacterium]|nr:lyase family protein [Pseudomonadota bacterium]
MSASLFDRFLSTAPMVEAFADEALLQGMLDFEAALVRAQAAEGVIPASAAAPITAACRAAGLDPKALVSAGSLAGTLVVPLVKALTARVAAADPPAAGWVHWGTTSQDVLDTAMVLSTRRAVALLDASMATLLRGLDAQARAHDEAPMLGRTLLQPAPVISVGVKLLSWFAPLVRARERLRTAAVAALR